MKTAQFMEEKKKMIIEELVVYFGEEYRDKITSKINDVVFISVPPKIVSLSERRIKLIEDWYDSLEGKEEEKKYVIGNLKESMNAIDEVSKFMIQKSEAFDKFFDLYDVDPDAKGFKYVFEGKTKKPNFKAWYSKLVNIRKEDLYDNTKKGEYARSVLKCIGVLYYVSNEVDVKELLQDEKFMNFAFNPEFHEFLKENNEQFKKVIKNTGFYKDSMEIFNNLNTTAAEKNNIDNTLFSYYLQAGANGQTTATTCHYLDQVDNRMKSVVILPLQCECIDDELIHELMHVLGTEIIETNDKGYVAKYGASLVSVDNSTSTMKTIDRKEIEVALDEAIVDLTAEDIAFLMHRKGKCLASFSGRISEGYEVTAYIRSLYYQNKKLLQSSIISDDPNAIEKVFGASIYSDILEYLGYVEQFVNLSFSERENLRGFPNLDEMEEKLLDKVAQYITIDYGSRGL